MAHLEEAAMPNPSNASSAAAAARRGSDRAGTVNQDARNSNHVSAAKSTKTRSDSPGDSSAEVKQGNGKASSQTDSTDRPVNPHVTAKDRYFLDYTNHCSTNHAAKVKHEDHCADQRNRESFAKQPSDTPRAKGREVYANSEFKAIEGNGRQRDRVCIYLIHMSAFPTDLSRHHYEMNVMRESSRSLSTGNLSEQICFLSKSVVMETK